MKSGYDQFFKSARNAADGKPASVKISKSAQPKYPQKKKRVQAKFPIISFIISIIGFCGAYAGFENYEKLESLLGKVEISLFSQAVASDVIKKEASAAGAEATNFSKPVVAEPTGEELNHLMKLAERKKELDAREEELNRMETEMAKQKEELQKKVADLEKMRNSISSILEERVKGDDQKIETLVQFYSNMKPPQAAKIFETLDEDLGVQILGRMKKKNAAEILNLMKAEKAQMFTEKFAGYKRTVASQGTDSKNQPEDEATNAPTKP